MSYSLLRGFVVRVAREPTHDHWQGGPARHEGAYCVRCKRPLLLIWDINCRDPRFEVENGWIFKELVRLPLYYCWTCSSEISYKVIDETRIRVIQNIGHELSADFPYPNYPLQYQRQPIELSRPSEMPDEIQQLFADDFGNPLPDETKAALSYWLGHEVKDSSWDLWWQQFGGEPWLVQGEESIVCPNQQCPAAHDRISMKILASVSNYPPSGLPMIETLDDAERCGGVFNRWAQVVFHVCDKCFTVHACNRCD